jgi:tryptophan synthase beta chain
MSSTHGSTPAAWSAVVICLVGFTVGGIGLVIPSATVFWVGIALLPLSLIVGKGMSGRRLRCGPHRGDSRQRRDERPLIRPCRPVRPGRSYPERVRSRRPNGVSRMSVLEDIVAGARLDLAEREAAVPLAEVKQQAVRTDSALDPMPVFRADGVSVIAEVKRASPSKGTLAAIDDPAALAAEYESGGAAAVSVLTEGRRFGGSLDDLRSVRRRVSIPVLRKDFIVSSYQLWEARAAGADMALLIVAALDQPALVSLVERAESIGLTPMVEVHDELEAGAGAGRRRPAHRRQRPQPQDPRGRPRRLRPVGPPDPRARDPHRGVGVRGPRDVIEYARAGADVVLVGETLVTGDDPRASVADLGRGRCPPRAQVASLSRGADHGSGDDKPMTTFADPQPDATGHFGRFGGRFMPEALIGPLDELELAWRDAMADDEFTGALDRMLREYAGVPSLLYDAARLSEAAGARILLKREDLNHTGAHKVRNVLGQALLTKRMGKPRVIAETGAGQHGVATATACAYLNLDCVIYMGAVDIERQSLNVARMRVLGPRWSRSRRAVGRSRTPSTRRCATGWPTSTPRTTCWHGLPGAPVPGHGPRLHSRHRRRGPRPGAGPHRSAA